MREFLEVTEIELQHIATILKLVIEGIAILIIAFLIFQTFYKFIHSYRNKKS